MERLEFLQKHIEDLQKQIWLMEVDLYITNDVLRDDTVIKNRKEEEGYNDQSKTIQANIIGMQARIQMVKRMILAKDGGASIIKVYGTQGTVTKTEKSI